MLEVEEECDWPSASSTEHIGSLVNVVEVDPENVTCYDLIGRRVIDVGVLINKVGLGRVPVGLELERN